MQRLLGSDIAMQMDECVRLPAERDDIDRAMLLSLRWAERSKRPSSARRRLHAVRHRAGRRHPQLRHASAQALVEIGFHGYAIGGLAVGEPQAVMLAMIDADRAGAAGRPAALSDGRRHARRSSRGGGARHRHVRLRDADAQWPPRPGLHAFGQVNLRNARHADDPRPLDEESSWPSARNYARAYLHHLVKAGETLGAMLLSEINLAYYQSLMQGIRDAIAHGTFDEF